MQILTPILGMILIVTLPIYAESPTESIDSKPTVILTLDDCITKAIENNTDLKNLLDRQPISHERIRDAKRKQWPSLSLSITDISNTSNSNDYGDPSASRRIIPGEGLQAAADLNVSLYDSGGRRSEIRLEKEALTLIDTSITKIRQDIVYQVISLYLAVLERQAEVDVRTEQLAQAHESLNVAKGRLHSGASIEYVVLLEEAYFAQAQADLLAVEYALNNARRALLLVMYEDINANIDLALIDIDAIFDISDTALIETAIANRMEFHHYNAEIESYRQQLKLIRAARYPTLDFFASYSRQGENFDAMKHADIDWSAGLSFRFSPFRDVNLMGTTSRHWINSSDFMQRNSLGVSLNDGSTTRSKEAEILAAIRKLQLELTHLEDVVGAEALTAWEMYQSSRAMLLARQKGLAAMEENERIQQKQYELGLNQYKDVVDARAERVAAKITLNRASYSMEHYKMNLEYVLGLLGYQESSK